DLITHLPPQSTSSHYTTLFRSRVAGSIRRAPDATTLSVNIQRRVRGPVWPNPHRPSGVREARATGKASLGLGPWYEDDWRGALRSEEHTSELQSREKLVCRLLL